jgi:RNA polymerase sigma-70 factor (ECF subfamily)
LPASGKKELSFKSYLFTIAFNIIRRHFRAKAQLYEFLESRIREDLDLDTSEKISYDSLHQYITELVNQLPDRRKIIFIKSRFDRLSIKEISEELNISHKTVENQLTSALKFLRSRINRENICVLLFFSLFIL